jgi:hypothetical protein
VKESTANEPLAFATITSVDGSTTISDVDGKFSISSKKSMPSLTFPTWDILKLRFHSKRKSYYSVSLLRKRDDLKEVLISNENPALA